MTESRTVPPRFTPDSVYQVLPGRAPLTLPNVEPETLFFNADTVNAIWVSESPSVAPNAGMPIYPQGSITWQKYSSRVYAVVDTGVLTPITLYVSGSVTNPFNPVGVALAVAALGVPSVLQSTKLFSAFVSSSGNALAVGKYGTLFVQMGNLNNTSPLVILYQFTDSATGALVDEGILTADNVTGTLQPSWILPVVSDTFTITNKTTGAPIARVIGTNQVIGSKKMLGAHYPTRQFQGTVPANSVSGTRVQLTHLEPDVTGLLIPDCSNYNGQTTYIIVASGSITGQYQYGYLDALGNRQFIGILGSPGTAPVNTQLGHPFGFITWWFITTATSPAVAVATKLVVIQAEVS